MSNPSKYDFTSWLETQNPDREYNFCNSAGGCLMGQFMTSIGERWNINRYQYLCDTLIGGHQAVLRQEPQTMGDALKRVRLLEDA